MVKRLVRLALASEYSRKAIRREDITKKGHSIISTLCPEALTDFSFQPVMAPSASRQIRQIFTAANDQLIHTFGMTLTELPAREKVTVAQKRAAQRSAGNNSTKHSSTHRTNGDLRDTQSAAAAFNTNTPSNSKQYILTSTLPSRYRHHFILPPSRIPTQSYESSYTGLTTFVVSLIYLSPGHTLSEARLDKHLRTLNADDFVLGEKTERGALARMQREGYIVKVRERGAADAGGEDSVDFVVGPRGKVEVGERGVAGLVRGVYGKDDADEVERRLVRSLGHVVVQKKPTLITEDGVNGVEEEGRDQVTEEEAGADGRRDVVSGIDTVEPERRGTRRASGRNGRGRDQEEDQEQEDEGDEEEDEEDEDENEENEEEEE